LNVLATDIKILGIAVTTTMEAVKAMMVGGTNLKYSIAAVLIVALDKNVQKEVEWRVVYLATS